MLARDDRLDRSPAEEGRVRLTRAAEPVSIPALPRVIGHRGAAAVAPENTLASLRKAKQLGAKWVEFDVKLTRDGVPVLIHDDRLERTTNGAGRVADTSFAALRRLDAGSWFGPEFRGEPVPTLDEALALCAELGLGINVELKPCPGRAEETARIALERLLDLWPAGQPPPLVSSFARACLVVAQDIAPALPRGYLCRRVPRHWASEMAQLDCITLHASHLWLRGGRIAQLAAAGVPLLLYTVNDGARARDLLAMGATAVFADRVSEVLAAVGETPAPHEGGERTDAVV
jgi:glycerophosphoryl diester phosphodiesterase